MSNSQTEHAKQVVEAFKGKLNKKARENISKKHLKELELLVESAIDAAVFVELERVADKMKSFSKEVRISAERFD
ncbi:MAG: phosphatase [Gammaproteobacteria bacterium]|nr:MAG: phosphatase [Gammaproteobacteria bacterium]